MILLILILYLTVIFCKFSFKVKGDLRGAFIVCGWLLFPALIIAWFIYDGNLLSSFDKTIPGNQNPDSWWIIPGNPEKGISDQINVISTTIVFSTFYIFGTLFVSFLSYFYYKKNGIALLSNHKALLKWALISVGCGIFLKIKLNPHQKMTMHLIKKCS
jgi:hypothetical protein